MPRRTQGTQYTLNMNQIQPNTSKPGLFRTDFHIHLGPSPSDKDSSPNPPNNPRTKKQTRTHRRGPHKSHLSKNLTQLYISF